MKAHAVGCELCRLSAPLHRRSRLALTLVEREDISRVLAVGQSIRLIALRLERAPSTINREISHNGGQLCYRVSQADQAAWDRSQRPKLCNLAQPPKLAQLVAKKPQIQWSPEQIAGWLKRTYPDAAYQVSHETIYRSLFIQTRGALKKNCWSICAAVVPCIGRAITPRKPTTTTASATLFPSVSDQRALKIAPCQVTGKETYCVAARPICPKASPKLGLFEAIFSRSSHAS